MFKPCDVVGSTRSRYNLEQNIQRLKAAEKTLFDIYEERNLLAINFDIFDHVVEDSNGFGLPNYLVLTHYQHLSFVIRIFN